MSRLSLSNTSVPDTFQSLFRHMLGGMNVHVDVVNAIIRQGLEYVEMIDAHEFLEDVVNFRF